MQKNGSDKKRKDQRLDYTRLPQPIYQVEPTINNNHNS